MTHFRTKWRFQTFYLPAHDKFVVSTIFFSMSINLYVYTIASKTFIRINIYCYINLYLSGIKTKISGKGTKTKTKNIFPFGAIFYMQLYACVFKLSKSRINLYPNSHYIISQPDCLVKFLTRKTCQCGGVHFVYYALIVDCSVTYSRLRLIVCFSVSKSKLKMQSVGYILQCFYFHSYILICILICMKKIE